MKHHTHTLADLERQLRAVKRAKRNARNLILGRWWSLKVLWRGFKLLRQCGKAERSFEAVIARRTSIGFRCSLTKKKQRKLGLLPPIYENSL